MPQKMIELLLEGNYIDFFSSQVEGRLYNWEVTVKFPFLPCMQPKSKGSLKFSVAEANTLCHGNNYKIAAFSHLL